MAKFFVGQRIKKVRGEYVGGVARVCAEEPHHFNAIAGCDITVIAEVGTNATSVMGYVVFVAPGEKADTRSADWEPIIPDGHRASEFSFTELMDRCREGVSV